jgi:hypothetical protein
MKLNEIANGTSLKQCVKQFIEYVSDPSVSTDLFGNGDFVELCTEPGNCSMISEELYKYLVKNHFPAKLITCYYAMKPSWPKNAGVTPDSDEDAHTAVRVNDYVVDLTAKQFDSSLPMPRIVSLTQFKSEWEECDQV